MKRQIVQFLHAVVYRFHSFKLVIERFYIRTSYSHVVNDLHIYHSEKYDPLGVYVTLNSKPPKNYKEHILSFNCDENGIRRFSTTNENQEKCLVYNSIHIAHQGLTEYGYFLYDKKPERMLIMEKVANWFVDNQDDATGAWVNHFDLYNSNVSSWLKDPWISAMGEGQVISFLCRYYSLTKDERYLSAARRGLSIFHVPVEEGGVVSFYQGKPVYEEYPTKPASFTLNGFLYSLFGLYDLYKIGGIEEAKALFDEGISTLESILPLYDDSHITYYDLGYITAPLRKPTQNSKYHLIHIKLLKNLCSISDNKTIRFYADKWSNQ